MRIAIMMRAMDQDSGFRSIVEGLVDNMLRIDRENEYLLLYRTTKWLGRFASYPQATEVLVEAPHKLLWDQWAVPRRAWKERADVIFNPKFTVPLVSHCPVTMGLQEPAWWAWPEHYEKLDVRYMRLMLPIYCRRAAHVFPNSQFILDENRKYLRLPLEHATVTHTAPKPYMRRVSDPSRLAACREKLGLPDRFLLSVTRVDHPGLEGSTSFHGGKNPEATLRAFLQLRDRIPHTLVFAGRRVQDYMLYLGFTEQDFERVRFLGFVPHEELPCLYTLADVCVVPSHYEGCPAVPMEALACGCPVVASKTGGCPEVVGDAALLASPTEPAEIASRIRAILCDEALAEGLRARGPGQAATFSWERSARLTIEGLTEAVRRRAPG